MNIGDAIALDHPRRALTFVAEIEARCHDLIDLPLLHPLLPDHKSSGIHRMVHGNYMIFYVVAEDIITILHVLRGSMNYEEILFPDKRPLRP